MEGESEEESEEEGEESGNKQQEKEDDDGESSDDLNSKEQVYDKKKAKGVLPKSKLENAVQEAKKLEKTKLDKTGLNDVLVKLRRPITQAKVVHCLDLDFDKFVQVHVIHKLTKDISQLRKRKTKGEMEKGKNERKVARFVQEVQVRISRRRRRSR